MIGNPRETREDVEKTQRFIKRNNIDCPGICITTPFPGTKLWLQCKEKGFIPDKINWNDFNYEKAPIRISEYLSTEEVEKLWRETIDKVHYYKIYFWHRIYWKLMDKKFVKKLKIIFTYPYKILFFLFWIASGKNYERKRLSKNSP